MFDPRTSACSIKIASCSKLAYFLTYFFLVKCFQFFFFFHKYSSGQCTYSLLNYSGQKNGIRLAPYKSPNHTTNCCVDYVMRFVDDMIKENKRRGNGENAGCQHFLLFPYIYIFFFFLPESFLWVVKTRKCVVKR